MSDTIFVECAHHHAYCDVVPEGDFLMARVRFERKSDQDKFRIPSITHKLVPRFQDRKNALVAAVAYAEERSESGKTELD